MPAAIDASPLNILHVLTLNGRRGEYGGPVRVARELCAELNSRGHRTHIFSGALKDSEPHPNPGLSESFVIVKPVLKSFPVSSLWSWRLLAPMRKQIKSADLVHIHFARDAISFLAALLSIFNHKPFVSQSHGMLISDGRISTRLIDFLFTRNIIKKSCVNFVLSEAELSSVMELGIKSQCKVLPNGIAVSLNQERTIRQTNRIVFCSRLEKRKGVGKFIELAEAFQSEGVKFEIYGPDAGELQYVETEIQHRNLTKVIEYKGSLEAEQVQSVLAEADLLVLPSKNEPFPMVILEALAVGTPVLVMPSCGFAEKLKRFESSFVADTEDLPGIIFALNSQKANQYLKKSHFEIIQFCFNEFSIKKVVNQLIEEYSILLNHE